MSFAGRSKGLLTIVVALIAMASAAPRFDAVDAASRTARVLVDPGLARGLVCEVRPVAERPGSLSSDAVVARAFALQVERGASATPFVAPGPFRAEFRGLLEVERRDDYIFSFEGRGKLTLEVDGEVVLEGAGNGTTPVVGAAVRLKKGSRALVARYQSTLSGAGNLRVSWENRKLARETIPPTALGHDASDIELMRGAERRLGRTTLATRRCTACHRTDASAMPELAMRGPSLADAGARLRFDWLAAWIAAPHALRADARMPDVLLGDEAVRARDAADLAAFVVGLGSPPGDAPPAGDAEAGARVWATLGCFACHALDDADRVVGEPDAWISLARVGAKFRPGAIAAFVAAPGAHDPWIRMPDLRLSAEEARDVEAYVRSRALATVPTSAQGDPVRGRERFAALGCANCHAAGVGPIVTRSLGEVLASGLERGCLGADEAARGTAPDFRLTAAERDALRAFAASGVASLARDSDADFAARQFAERRCNACHAIDGRTADWVVREELVADLVPLSAAPESGALVEVAQLRPALTWAGEKLRGDWLERFLRGDEPSPRPWLRARMPRLPAAITASLARGMAAQHGLGEDDPVFDVDAGRTATGRRLIEQEGGFGCVTCHAVGDRMPAALFEVQGVNLARVADRLRVDWYRRWMMDPPRFEPAAKMPKYVDDSGHTAIEALGGDAGAQFDAIWHFLNGTEVRR